MDDVDNAEWNRLAACSREVEQSARLELPGGQFLFVTFQHAELCKPHANYGWKIKVVEAQPNFLRMLGTMLIYRLPDSDAHLSSRMWNFVNRVTREPRTQ